MKILFPILFSMSMISACDQGSGAATEVYLPARDILNVSYGKDSLQRMDVYLPAGRTTDSTRSIVLIHGGGWNTGSKSEFISHIDSIKKRLPGYAIFNLNYRLVNGGNLFPAQEKDIRSAIDFIASKAEEYGINQNKLVLLGASAGAHLALLHAYKYRNPRILAVIDFFGPTDLVAMYERPWHPLVPFALQMVTGTTPASNNGLFKTSSPVNFVDGESAPTLILHGEKDQIVNVSQSKLLKSKLEKAGVPHELILYPREKHGWTGSVLSHSFDQIESFLKTHVP